jgi:catechol 2,3-dioxygenase-like lactoylglutathione lyase family enzyme
VIVGFDHVVIAVRDIDAGIRDYTRLLGAEAETASRDGVATALIAAGDMAVELMAPVRDGAAAQRLNIALADGGEGLKSLVFRVQDIEKAHRRMGRVGLAPEEIVVRDQHASFRLSTEHTHGVRIFLIRSEAPRAAREAGPADMIGIDHIVVRTAQPERAAALYGARLGLDMRLDREIMGRRLMFFRCGDAILELAQDAATDHDKLWGLSWRVQNADAARARLAATGLDVSEVRAGMKPGTRVFTVRSGACGVPTLMIEHSPAHD